MSDLSVVILAAGQGKRMFSDLPKVLHPIGGRPLLAHVVATALELDPTRVVVVYGHGGQVVPETDDTSIKVLEVSDKLMLVTILSLPCLANTNKLLRSLTELGYVPKDKIKVIPNRYVKRSEISLSDAEAGIGKELFWVIPNDYDTSMAAINSGKALLNLAPGASITKSFIELAKSLSEPEANRTEKKRILS